MTSTTGRSALPELESAAGAANGGPSAGTTGSVATGSGEVVSTDLPAVPADSPVGRRAGARGAVFRFAAALGAAALGAVLLWAVLLGAAFRFAAALETAALETAALGASCSVDVDDPVERVFEPAGAVFPAAGAAGLRARGVVCRGFEDPTVPPPTDGSAGSPSGFSSGLESTG